MTARYYNVIIAMTALFSSGHSTARGLRQRRLGAASLPVTQRHRSGLACAATRLNVRPAQHRRPTAPERHREKAAGTLGRADASRGPRVVRGPVAGASRPQPTVCACRRRRQASRPRSRMRRQRAGDVHTATAKRSGLRQAFPASAGIVAAETIAGHPRGPIRLDANRARRRRLTGCGHAARGRRDASRFHVACAVCGAKLT